MRKIFLITILSFLFLNTSKSNDNIRVSLLTCSQSVELYSSFGHSAIRIIDSKNNFDIIYNFGIFDFNTPNFYGKFANGIMLYQIGRQKTSNFIKDYTEENRWVIEQEIFLTPAEKTNIVELLNFLYKPENKFYYYDFLKNNCSTKLRDVVLKSINRKINFNNITINKSYRDLITECLFDKKWTNLGINLILGSLIDYEVTANESMFLPIYLSNYAKNATINNQPLVGESKQLNVVNSSLKDGFSIFNPIILFSILALITIVFRSKKLQYSIFGIIGFLSILIITLWFFTEQTYSKDNYNILWCNPLYLIILIFIALKKTKTVFLITYTLLLCQFAMIIVWFTGVQGFDIAFIPLFLMLMVYNLRMIKSNLQHKIQK